MQYNKRTVN